MDMFLVNYVLLATLVFGINVIPAFMPPTWTVLAFFVTKYDLQIIPVVLLGASFATLGRILLAKLSEKYFRRFLSEDSKSNYDSIGEYLNSHKKLTIPLVIAYAFLPIPSNHVFIAAGLAKVKIKPLAISFFIGRLISYTFWVSLTQRLSDNLEGIFSNHFSKIGSIAIEIIGLLILYFLGKIAWKKILKRVNKTS
ncbi:hypothetical protein M1437_03100 [Patescibacteria group bacterium]|nr:hypothetical protein [Patescibacteria group bacterium]